MDSCTARGRAAGGAHWPARMAAGRGALALALTLAVLPMAPGGSGARLTPDEIQRLSAESGDPEFAAATVPRLRSIIAANPADGYALFARRLLLRALMTMRAPVGEIVAQADSTSPMIPHDPMSRLFFNSELSQYLVARGGAGDRALHYAREAVAAVPEDFPNPQAIGIARAALGAALLANGDHGQAIRTLAAALPVSPDSQRVLGQLGAAYEAAGQPERAIDTYVRALSVFGSEDSSSAPALRALYAKRHGSLAGLEARLEAARRASRDQEVFVARRDDREAPDWSLPDFDGKSVRLSDHKGQVVVLDFWGSWCGPCRMELPHFQAVYERYKERGVVFYGVNWERPGPAAQRRKAAKDYMEASRFTFPVVLDHDEVATRAYGVEAFPTVYLIDRGGRVRFKNVGFSPEIGQILTLQIDSLLGG